MSGESAMRQKIVHALRHYDAMAVENPVRPGTPDVNCTLGWIELKSGRVFSDLSELTPQQRIWLRRRWLNGGLAVLLVHVKDTWFLFAGNAAFDLKYTDEDFEARMFSSTKKFSETWLIRELKDLMYLCLTGTGNTSDSAQT